MEYKDTEEEGIPKEYIEELRQLMSDYNLPFITIQAHNKESQDTPLLIICGKIEALVNSVLSDIFFARMKEGGYLLASLEGNLDNLLSLSSYLRLKHEKGKLSKVLSKIQDITPVPKIFDEEFKKAWENNKSNGKNEL